MRDSARKRLRLSQATTVWAPPASVLDAVERDLRDCGTRDLEAIDISVGDTDDDQFPGTVDAEMASNPQDPCGRFAEVVHTQAGRPPTGRLVLMGTQVDSVPPTLADPVNSTVFEASDTDVLESDTANLFSDDPVEGADGTTESEPEQALPIPEEQQRVHRRTPASRRIHFGGSFQEARTYHEVCSSHHAMRFRISNPFCIR